MLTNRYIPKIVSSQMQKIKKSSKCGRIGKYNSFYQVVCRQLCRRSWILHQISSFRFQMDKPLTIWFKNKPKLSCQYLYWYSNISIASPILANRTMEFSWRVYLLQSKIICRHIVQVLFTGIIHQQTPQTKLNLKI